MKAMVLSAPNELALGEVARPAIGEGQVLVRVTYSGICGTDYKIYSGAIPVRYPRIMGHEMIGEVVEAGADAAVRPGRSRHHRSGTLLRRLLPLPHRADASLSQRHAAGPRRQRRLRRIS